LICDAKSFNGIVESHQSQLPSAPGVEFEVLIDRSRHLSEADEPITAKLAGLDVDFPHFRLGGIEGDDSFINKTASIQSASFNFQSTCRTRMIY
jgi:hypothetical protein